MPADEHLGAVPQLDEHYLLRWEREDIERSSATPEHVTSRKERSKLREEERIKHRNGGSSSSGGGSSYSSSSNGSSRSDRSDRDSSSTSSTSSSEKGMHGKTRGRPRGSTTTPQKKRNTGTNNDGNIDKIDQPALIIGEIVEITPRSGKGRNWEGGTAKLLAVYPDDTMDVKYVIGGKGNKLPKYYVRRFGTPSVAIPPEIEAKLNGTAIGTKGGDAYEIPPEFMHGVVVSATGVMYIAPDSLSTSKTSTTSKKTKSTKDAKSTKSTKSTTATSKKPRRAAAAATEAAASSAKATKGARLKNGSTREEVTFVVRCWTGTCDPDPRPNIYFGKQRLSTVPLKDVDESDLAKKQQLQEINDSATQKPATAHSWRHADRPSSSAAVDVQVRVDNTLSKMYLPLNLDIDRSPSSFNGVNGEKDEDDDDDEDSKESGLPNIKVEMKGKINIITKDTEEQNQLCDEICAELQYLQWKLDKTIAQNKFKTKPLIHEYKKLHVGEMIELEERNGHRDAINALREQVIAAQQEKERVRLQKENEERTKLIRVRCVCFKSIVCVIVILYLTILLLTKIVCLFLFLNLFLQNV